MNAKDALQTVAKALNVKIYPDSVHRQEGRTFFVARQGWQKGLYGLYPPSGFQQAFQDGQRVEHPVLSGALLYQYPMNHANARVLQELFAFTRPVLIGVHNSFGFGDRLGLANPAHLRALGKSRLRPVLAQQSIRELERTQRTPEEVMDAAVWAVFQEGYHDGFGADADHLKTPQDMDRLVRAGFTMFTFDPGEYVINEADGYDAATLEARKSELDFSFIGGNVEMLCQRYVGQSFRFDDGFELVPTRMEVLRALMKYGGVIDHAIRMYRHLHEKHAGHPAEVELSIDETEAVTTPFEHFFIANELRRNGVQLVSLAPRFVGRFEKGIDYIGDVAKFQEEYVKHVAIAHTIGPYKISIHSGSDKFKIYEAIGRLQKGHVHIKTAGTSYLEALRTIAIVDVTLFREILDFAREQYSTEKRTYHVSAELSRVPGAAACSDRDLPALLNQDDTRQVLHVTFGKVLTAKTPDGTYRFRNRIMECLQRHEELHYELVAKHLGRHVKCF